MADLEEVRQRQRNIELDQVCGKVGWECTWWRARGAVCSPCSLSPMVWNHGIMHTGRALEDSSGWARIRGNPCSLSRQLQCGNNREGRPAWCGLARGSHSRGCSVCG